MTRTRLIRVAGLAAGGAIIAGGFFGVVAAQQSNAALASDNLAPNVVVLLLAGMVIAALAWVLADDRDSADGDGADATTHCDACGGVINADWRLCPHCGERRATFGAPSVRR